MPIKPVPVPPEVSALIARFSSELLRISADAEHKSLPVTWKNALLKSLAPAPKRRGPGFEAEQWTAITKSLTERMQQEWRERGKGDDFKADESPPLSAAIRKEIAAQHGVSERTVKRIEKARRDYFTGALDDDAEVRAAVLAGITADIGAEVVEDGKSGGPQ